MNRYRLTAAAALIASVAMLFGAGGAATATTAADETVPGKLLLMLDASGSMKAKDPSGLTKIEAAKKALTGVVGALPDTAQVGLRVYGAKVDGKGKPTPAACADTQLIHPIGALDKAKLTSTIAAIEALGETPIAHSLEEAMKDLGATGKRNIVLVSDGEESCVPDPCPTVKKLTAAGVDLQIDTVGFGVNAKARQQLQCIADAGQGTYYDAKDAGALTTSLSKLSQRALRPFAISGTPVEGALDGAEPPTLTPGQYTDSITAAEDRPLRYRLKRTIPGSTIHASFASLPQLVEKDTEVEAWSVQLRTDDQDNRSCDHDASGQDRFTSLMNLAVLSKPEGPCAEGDSLIFEVERRWGAPGSAPFEILFLEEPPVVSVKGLPERHPDGPYRTATPSTIEPVPAVGGTSFSNALEIAPGTYVDQLMPGESTFFRLPVDFGQSVTYTILGPPESYPWPSTSLRVTTDGAVFGPDRHKANGPDGAASFNKGGSNEGVVKWVPPIRYLNRESVRYGGASMAGPYTIALSVSPDIGAAQGTQPGPVPIVFRVDREGEVTGKPTYAAAGATASASPSASPSTSGTPTAAANTNAKPAEDGPNLLVRLGPVALLLLIGGAATWFVRRRRSTHPGGPPEQ